MKPLRNLFDRLHPLFEKDGKLERLYPLYEGVDTFLFTPGETTTGPSHIRDGMDLKRMMITVVVALIPCIFMAFYNTGYHANRIVQGNRELQNAELIGNLRTVGATVSAEQEEAIVKAAGSTTIDAAITAAGVGSTEEIAAARAAGEKQRLLQGLAGLVESKIMTQDQVDAVANDKALDCVPSSLSDSAGWRESKAVLALTGLFTDDKAKLERLETELTAHVDREVERQARTGSDDGWRSSIMASLTGFDPNSFLSNIVHGGLYFIPVFLVCNIVGGTWELIFCCVRGHDLNEGFLVTGMLFPLTLPPTIPLWQVALGISFGVVIGKEVFGGTGKNFLNPALTARAFLYFAHPGEITGDQVWTAIDTASFDAVSGATSLTGLASIDKAVAVDFTQYMQSIHISWNDAFLGFIPGSMGETSTLACILGATLLIWSGVGSWRIMAAVLIGAVGMAGFLHSFETTAASHIFKMPAEWHMVTGGLAFGLVFMATDPVSAAMTNTGKWVYGILIGIMTMLIRVVNPAFPEGIMLAILFGNVFAPLIDYFVVQANINRRLARSGV